MQRSAHWRWADMGYYIPAGVAIASLRRRIQSSGYHSRRCHLERPGSAGAEVVCRSLLDRLVCVICGLLIAVENLNSCLFCMPCFFCATAYEPTTRVALMPCLALASAALLSRFPTVSLSNFDSSSLREPDDAPNLNTKAMQWSRRELAPADTFLPFRFRAIESVAPLPASERRTRPTASFRRKRR